MGKVRLFDVPGHPVTFVTWLVLHISLSLSSFFIQFPEHASQDYQLAHLQDLIMKLNLYYSQS
jgi:hypothetical protein